MSSASIPVSYPSQDVGTILIVEDEALIRVVMSDTLQDRGFKVLEAANANEAIEIIEHAQVEIDLVFTDVRMPGAMDGFGLVRWMQTSRPHVPVIVASGDVGKANGANLLDIGAMFIPKPYDLDLAAAKIRQAVATRKRAPAPGTGNS